MYMGDFFPICLNLRQPNKTEFGLIFSFSLIYFQLFFKLVFKLKLELLIFRRHTASFNILISKVQDLEVLKFHPCM